MKKILVGLGFFLPAIAFAQTLQTAVGVVQSILNVVVPIMVTLAIIYFIWGIIQYVMAGDAEKKEQGQQHMIYGLIAIFVIVSIWGLVAVLANTFGVNNQNGVGSGGGTGTIPCVTGFNPNTGACN